MIRLIGPVLFAAAAFAAQWPAPSELPEAQEDPRSAPAAVGTSGSSVRASRMVEARPVPPENTGVRSSEAEPLREAYIATPRSSSGLARTTAGTDDLPASDPSRALTTPRSHRDDPAAVLAAVGAAAAEFGTDAASLEAVAMCESTWNVDAVGAAQEVGLYQWLPQTWAWLGRISGLGYTVRDIGDVRAQARLTAWAFANGYAHHWTCAR